MEMEGERIAFQAEAKARVTRRIIACVCNRFDSRVSQNICDVCVDRAFVLAYSHSTYTVQGDG